MASRREEKERLRQEREQRDAAAQSSQRRRQLIGYGAGGAVVLIAVIVAIALLAGGGGSGGSASADVLPDGGQFATPDDDVESLAVAAKGAGCELESHRARTRRHLEDLDEEVDYASKPPTSGPHYPPPAADDDAYEEAPDPRQLVHTMEHGRVIVWFKRSLPAEQRAALKAYYDHDPYQLVLTPYPGRMPYDVAVTAWNRDPRPNGTGRLLGCPNYNDRIFTAIEAFKDENRGIGPEPIP